MLVLDENLPAGQRQRLREWRVRFRVVGMGIAHSGIQDENLIPALQRLAHPTFFSLVVLSAQRANAPRRFPENRALLLVRAGECVACWIPSAGLKIAPRLQHSGHKNLVARLKLAARLLTAKDHIAVRLLADLAPLLAGVVVGEEETRRIGFTAAAEKRPVYAGGLRPPPGIRGPPMKNQWE